MKKENAKMRARRIRSRIHGTAERPRLSVHVSNTHITAQLINDDIGETIAYASSIGKKSNGTMMEKAVEVGKDIAIKAKKAKCSKAVFDKGSRKYHGRIKALADAAREGGLDF